MWCLNPSPLLLASESPRRLELLRQMGLAVQALRLPPQPQDEPVLAGESVVAYVTRTCADKNQRARQYIADAVTQSQTLPVLTGDTTVALDGQILGKPADRNEAIEFLARLSGQTHDVYSAVTLSHNDRTEHALSHSQVTFGVLSSEQIEAYVHTGEPYGKAGAYAVQGYAAGFIQRIEGSYTGIVGLPLFETIELLQTMGLITPD